MASADVGDSFIDFLNQKFVEVDEAAWQRHMAGAEQYGPLKFLGADTLEEALQELYDLINYARYTAVKVKLLQQYISDQASASEDPSTTGGEFISMSSWLKKGFNPE
jgi:hypothetical protein